MADLNNKDAPLVKHENAFNEDYRDLREKVALKVTQDSVTSADADATYGAPEQALLNELKSVVNSLIAKLE